MSQRPHGQIRDLLTPSQRQDLEYAYGRALVFAVKVLRLNKADADDVVGDAAVRAIERLDKYQPRPGVPFLSWFRRVLVNLVQDEHRRRERTERLRDPAADATTPAAPVPPDLNMANAQASLRRDQLLAELPRDIRTVFEVWAEQRARVIDREVAAERLGYSIAEYEAAKKRVEREVLRTMDRLGLRLEDVRSVMPSVASATATRHRGEEGGA